MNNNMPPNLQWIHDLGEKIKSTYDPLIEMNSRIIVINKNLKSIQSNIVQPVFEKIINQSFIQSLNSISQKFVEINNNPEFHFEFLTNLEYLNLKSIDELNDNFISELEKNEIDKTEALLEKNLVPLLDNIELLDLWKGANYAVESKENPDRYRHCFISLRTLLESLIEIKLAPNDLLKDEEIFTNEFKKYHQGKTELRCIKISRKSRIEYFTSKLELGFVEMTPIQIEYICECYTYLCDVHNPVIDLTENQVKSIKARTGITIWLLAYIYNILGRTEK